MSSAVVTLSFGRQMKLQAGEQLGPYQVLALIGAGGMGEVYRARDSRIGRDVAVKVLPCSATSDLMRRFEQEARAAGMLNHPNVLTVYDVGSHDGSPFIVSELLEGTSLRAQLATRLPLRKAVEYAQQIARGLAAAHDKGIVHRDLKPENIFILDDGRVKLLDFGLVKLLRPETTPDSETQQLVTDAGTVLGTAGYMSPEQVRGEAADHRSDIFSQGVVMFEMLTGHQPFRRDTAVETMNAILHDDVLVPSEVPGGVARITQRMLEKNPSDRFQSVKDLAFALEAVEGSDSSLTMTPTPSRKRATKTAMKSAPLHYERLTFRRGFIMTARFLQGGSMIYGAAWEDKPVEVYTSSTLSPESRPIGAGHADLLAVSSTGELAVSLGRRYLGGFATSGTIARMPLGGAPRVLCENAQDADWSPDGRSLMIIRSVGGMHRIEWPIGTVIYETPTWLSHARISPKGDLIAFIEHPVWGDDGGTLVVIDRNGKVRVRSSTLWNTTGGIAWHPKGEEVWIAAAGHGADRDIHALTLAGKERMVLAFPGRITLHDIDSKSGVLITSDYGRREIVTGRHGESEERNLTWFDWSWLAGLTIDGRNIVLEEQGAAAHGVNAIYFRPTDGSPAVRLAEGRARGMPLSPDGKWILAMNDQDCLEMLPIGAGETRTVACAGMHEVLWWQFFPDGQRALLLGNRAGEPKRMYELWLDGSKPVREISPEVVTWPIRLSSDGKTVAAIGLDGMPRLFPIDGGAPRAIPGCTEEDVPIQWTADDRALYVYRRGRTLVPIDRIDVTSGERTHWVEIRPPDPAGVLDVMPIHITPDGETYAYGYRRFLSDLYLVTGLL